MENVYIIYVNETKYFNQNERTKYIIDCICTLPLISSYSCSSVVTSAGPHLMQPSLAATEKIIYFQTKSSSFDQRLSLDDFIFKYHLTQMYTCMTMNRI